MGVKGWSEQEGIMKSVIKDIDKRKQDAVDLLTEVSSILENRGIVSGADIRFFVGNHVEHPVHNDVYAYLHIQNTAKAIRLHAFVQLASDMYPKSDRRVITACSIVDYDKFKRGHRDQEGPRLERIIYNQDHSRMSAERIAEKIMEQLYK